MIKFFTLIVIMYFTYTDKEYQYKKVCLFMIHTTGSEYDGPYPILPMQQSSMLR